MGDFYSLLLALGKADDDFNTGKVSLEIILQSELIDTVFPQIVTPKRSSTAPRGVTPSPVGAAAGMGRPQFTW